jgi:hypothetical protein
MRRESSSVRVPLVIVLELADYGCVQPERRPPCEVHSERTVHAAAAP